MIVPTRVGYLTNPQPEEKSPVKAFNLFQNHHRLISLFATVSAVAFITFSSTADASGCGMMKKPGYLGMPMHGPGYRGMHKGKSYPPMRRPESRAGANVVDVARAGGEFGTLLTALEATGLTGLLEGEGPYTLLAPRDDAFKKLPEGALQGLLSDTEKLVAVLKYHVLPGRVTAVDILQSRELKTASGQPLPTVDLSVIRADLPARNGVVHVIDKVLMPAG